MIHREQGSDQGEADQDRPDLAGGRNRVGAVGGVVARRTGKGSQHVGVGLRKPRPALLDSLMGSWDTFDFST